MHPQSRLSVHRQSPHVPLFPLHLGLLALAGASAASAAPQFGEPRELTDSLDNPEIVRSVDLDGDGSLDLLASSEADGDFVWYRNQGGGAFGQKQVIGGGFVEPNYAAAADLDGDGTVDVYGGSIGNGSVHWFRGLGNGEFAGPVTLSNPSITVQTLVQAADVDSDGDLDLLVGLSGSDGLRWHENSGGGQFSAPATLLVPSTAVTSAQVGDVDADGTSDLVYDDNIVEGLFFRRGLGGGDFGPAIDLGVEPGLSGDLRLADLTGNGGLDVLYINSQTDRVTLVEGLGAGGFGAAQTVSSLSLFFSAFEVCDIDGDMDLDIVLGSQTGLVWFENQGSGQFSDANEILLGTFFDSVACGDFDGNGTVDVAFANPVNEVSWTRNLGIGAAFSGALAVSSFVAGPGDPILADLDGDGDLDALSTSFQAGRISSYENIGNGEFAPQRLLVDEEHQTDGLRSGDLDGDGDLDLVWHIRGDRAIRWLEQLSPQVYASPAEIAPLPAGPRDLALVDLDQDGDVDIVQPLVGGSGIQTYANQGGAVFSGPIVLPNVGAPISLAVGALTPSTLPDLMIRAQDGRIAFYRNTGQLSFAPPVVVAQATPNDFVGDIALADISGNGRLDLAWTDEDQVRWKENLGSGVFGATQSISTGGMSSFIEASDFDSDGDPDLIVTVNSSNVVILENDGGQLSLQLEVANSDAASRQAATGDIDGDGDIDLLLALAADQEIAWLSGETLEIVGNAYCGPAVANSTGQPANAFASGNLMSASNDFTLHATQLPTEMVGIFLASPNQGLVTSVPGSVGTLCLGASIGRFNMPGQVLVTSLAGTASLPIDLETIATPNGTVAVQPGETWNFQLWHRDLDPSPTSNFTQGVSVLFQ